MHSRATILGLLACTSCLVSAAPAHPASTSTPCSSSTSTSCSSSTSTSCSSSIWSPSSSPIWASSSTSCSSPIWSPSSYPIWTPSSYSTWSAPLSSAVNTTSSAVSTSSPCTSPLSVSQSVQTSSTVPVQPVQTSESTCGLSSSTSPIRAPPVTVNNTVTASGPTVTAPGTTVVSGTTVLCTVVSGTTVYKSVTTPGPTVTAPPIVHTSTVISGTTKTAPPTTVISGTTVFCTVVSGTTIYHPVTTTAPGTTVTAAPTTVISGKTVYCTVVSGTTLFQPVTAPGTTWTAPGTTVTAAPTTVISGKTVYCTVVSGTTLFQPVTAPGTTWTAPGTTVTAAPTTVISGKTVYCTVVSGTTLFQPVTAPGTTWTAPGTTVTAPPACQPSCTDSSKCNSCLPDIDIEVKVEIEGDCDDDDEQCTSPSTGHNLEVARKKPAQLPSGFKTVTKRGWVEEWIEELRYPTDVPIIVARNVPGTGTVVPINVEGVCPPGAVKVCDGALTPDTNGHCHCVYNEDDGCPDGAEKQCDKTGEICACAPHAPAGQSPKAKRSLPGGGYTQPIAKGGVCPVNSAKICDIKQMDCSCLFENDGCPDGKEKSCDIEGQNCACIAHADPNIYYPPVLAPNPPPGTSPQAIPPPAAIPQANPIPASTPPTDSPPANSKRAQENVSRSTTLNKVSVTTSDTERDILRRRDSRCEEEECTEWEKFEEEKPVPTPPSECEKEECEEEEEKPVPTPPSECEEKKCEEEPKKLTEEDYIKMAPHDFIDDHFPPPNVALMHFSLTESSKLNRRDWWQELYEGFQAPPELSPTYPYKQKPFTAEEKFANRQKKRHEFNDCVKGLDFGQCKIQWKQYESQKATVRSCTSKRGWEECWARYEKLFEECRYHMDNHDDWCWEHRYTTALKRQSFFDASKTPLPQFMYDKPDDVVQYHIEDIPVDPDAAYPPKQNDHTIISADTQAEPTSTSQSSDSQGSSTATTTSSAESETVEMLYTVTTLVTTAVDAPVPTGDLTFTTVDAEAPAASMSERCRKRDGKNDEIEDEVLDTVIPYPKRPLECNLDPTAPLCQLQKRSDKYLCLSNGDRFNELSHSCEGGVTSYSSKPARIMLATPMPVPTYRPDQADCERRRLRWHGGRCRTEDAGPPPPLVTEVANNNVGSPAFEACRYQKLSWSDGRCMTELAGPDTPKLDSMPPFPLPQSTIALTTTTTIEDNLASTPTDVSSSSMTPTTTEDDLASIPTDSSSDNPNIHDDALDETQQTPSKREYNDQSCREGETFYNGRCIFNDDDIFTDMKGCETDHGVWNVHFEVCEHPSSSDRASLISTPLYTSLPNPYGDPGSNIPDNPRDCEAQGYEWFPFYNGYCRVYFGPGEEEECPEDDPDKKKMKMRMKMRKNRKRDDSEEWEPTEYQKEEMRRPRPEEWDTKDPARKAPVDPSKQYAYCEDESPDRRDCYNERGAHCLAWDQWWGCLEWEEHPDE